MDDDDYYSEVKITKISKKGNSLIKTEKRKERFIKEEEEAKKISHLEKAFVRLGINDTIDTLRT